jgi:hypothetical protein
MARRAAIAAALMLLVAACAPAYVPTSTYPAAGATPLPAGDVTSATKQAVLGALAAAGLQATDANRAFRPPEGPLLAGAARSVIQVALADDPERGFIVVYAFDSPNAALAAANDHAAWVASSVGRINFAPGTRFVLRTLGSTVIWFSWLPGASADAKMDQIGPALETIGDAVTVPS